jgi:type I restriction enzyme, S subunit
VLIFTNHPKNERTVSNGAEVGTKKLFRIEPGDLLFNIVFAWEGAVAVAKPEDQGRVGSHRFLTCVPKSEVATAPFLCFHFLTERGLGQLGEASPGGAGRNRTLGLKALENIHVPVPPFDRQLWFDSIQSQLAGAMKLQARTATELSRWT